MPRDSKSKHEHFLEKKRLTYEGLCCGLRTKCNQRTFYNTRLNHSATTAFKASPDETIHKGFEERQFVHKIQYVDFK